MVQAKKLNLLQYFFLFALVPKFWQFILRRLQVAQYQRGGDVDEREVCPPEKGGWPIQWTDVLTNAVPGCKRVFSHICNTQKHLAQSEYCRSGN